MGRIVSCKKCLTPHLRWNTNSDGRWQLFDDNTNSFHQCTVRDAKEVKCTYCGADDLWWSKETMEDGSTKNMLIESYGLPHGCEERKKHFDGKKDEYTKEKDRVNALPNQSTCTQCLAGYHNDASGNYHNRLDICGLCGGIGKITPAGKKRYLAQLREKIWPGIGTSKYRLRDE